MLRPFFLFLLLFGSFRSYSQTISLSDNAQIYILTVAPGTELYSQFGHSALLVEDVNANLRVVYNYGVFDFRVDNFYLKFLRGQLPYQIGKADLGSQLAGWRYENRDVKAQLLNLSTQDKQAIFDYLEVNYRPENRNYFYKFFYDNCSTRLSDVLKAVKKDSIRFDETLHADSTYREWIDKYSRLNHNDWADFGMDLALGIPADQKADAAGAFFLPDNLFDGLNQAQIYKDGKWQPLVSMVEPSLLFIEPIQGMSTFFTPLVVTSLFLLIYLMYWFLMQKSQKKTVFFEHLLSLLFLLTSVVLLLLWFATDHGVTSQNLNVFWTFPVFWLVYFLKKEQFKRLSILVWSSLLIFLFLSPQEIHVAYIPLILLQFAMIGRLYLAKLNSIHTTKTK